MPSLGLPRLPRPRLICLPDPLGPQRTRPLASVHRDPGEPSPRPRRRSRLRQVEVPLSVRVRLRSSVPMRFRPTDSALPTTAPATMPGGPPRMPIAAPANAPVIAEPASMRSDTTLSSSSSATIFMTAPKRAEDCPAEPMAAAGPSHRNQLGAAVCISCRLHKRR